MGEGTIEENLGEKNPAKQNKNITYMLWLKYQRQGRSFRENDSPANCLVMLYIHYPS